MGKLADDLRPKCEHAHPDQRLEISLLGLFSYDRFSIVPPEKGWILPVGSYLSKPDTRDGLLSTTLVQYFTAFLQFIKEGVA